MVDMICPNCQGKQRTDPIQLSCTGRVNVKGIIQCDVCKHEFPFSMYGGAHGGSYIQKLDTSLPGVQSQNLTTSVPQGIKEDIEEAERANYNQCYKACVTMCRRALQLGLIDRGIPDKSLSEMLKEAKDVQNLLTNETYNLATSIKHFGDIGAHRKEKIEPEVAKLVM